MTNKTRAGYMTVKYPFNVTPDPEGGYVIEYPDLPGCMTQVESADEIPDAAEEIRELWIETALEQGREIPEPSGTPGYSGRFVVRIPKSLHRTLVMTAKREGVSLNQYASQALAQAAVLDTDRPKRIPISATRSRALHRKSRHRRVPVTHGDRS